MGFAQRVVSMAETRTRMAKNVLDTGDLAPFL